MAELKRLKATRAQIKGHVTRINTFLNTKQDITYEQAQSRYEKVQELWTSFNDTQTQIEVIRAQNDEQLEQITKEEEGERIVFEECYYKALDGTCAIMAAKGPQPLVANLPQDEQNRAGTIGNIDIRLPTLKLPTFAGEYDQWMQFKDAFTSLIHDNKKLSLVQKFQYLRSTLKDEALQTVSELSTSAENYAIAWDLLKERYENKKLIINSHLSRLLDFPTVTKDKHVAMKQFIMHIRTHLKALEVLKQPVAQWSAIIIFLATSKLDYHSQREWEMEIGQKGTDYMPTTEEFLDFLTERCRTLEMLNSSKNKLETVSKGNVKKNDKRITLTTTTQVCLICKESHFLYNCPEFLKQSAQDRLATAKKHQLCINCFKIGHYSRNCKSSKCRKCSRAHNTLLHVEQDNSSTKEPRVQESATKNSEESVSMHSVKIRELPDARQYENEAKSRQVSQVILSTAQVYIRNSEGNRHTCRVLLDPGSQSNFITEELVRKLQLPLRKESSFVNGLMRSITEVNNSTKVNIESQHTGFKADLDCLILPIITERLPQFRIEKKLLNKLEDRKLADPAFDKPGKIDLLIGAGLFWELLCQRQSKRTKGQPTWQKTQLGWIIGGEFVTPKTNTGISSFSHLVTNQVLKEQIEKFWTQEEMIEPRKLNTQENYCEKYFNETVSRDSTGRFIVCLPRNESITLGESKSQALKRFFSLERRFKRQPVLKQEYVQFMEDYEKRGHMSKILEENLKDNSYFLPHQPVIRPDSLTTKLRVVFDASAKTDNSKSLNDMLYPGPNLQADLLQILIRFRSYEYVLTGDIAMMFRQVLIADEDRQWQLILWRKNEEDSLDIFTLNTVTYGSTCAPYLAMRCLKQLAEEDGENYPLARQALISDFYMDNVLTGTDTIADAIDLQKQLMNLLKRGQFHLRKWRSNEEKILHHLLEESKTKDSLILSDKTFSKTLGVQWNHKEDLLKYNVKPTLEKRITKRVVLSKIAQIFDPLGLIGPILITAKVIMQQLWCLNIGWDEILPQDVCNKWKDYLVSFEGINYLEIPRKIKIPHLTGGITLHGFSDASERAYGACLYAVTQDKNGHRSCQLICAKTRVAPLKVITIAKLELCAALLLARLYKIVREALGNRIKEVHLWSDSTIVISWIRICPTTLKTFVANRISEIQSLGLQEVWRHVSSSNNPADILSRGATIDELQNNDLWWHGPKWLSIESLWPEQPSSVETELPEKKIIVHLAAVYKAMQKGSIPGSNSYSFGTRTCREGNHPTAADGGGRLRHAELPEEAKHPILLPAKHRVTGLIFKAEHLRLLHCGSEQLLAAVRQKYWTLSGRREARKATRSCLNCFRLHPSRVQAKMGDLPKTRITGFVRPFAISGVDYVGPLRVRESRRRGRVHISKAYVALFVCFNTKAVHLELVTDLTTEAFIAASRRFTGRRGICSQLHSDNATNFIGAAKELKEVYEFLSQERETIQKELTKQKIDWRFIPPRAPNFGGLWESAVKSMKKHFYAVTKGLMLTLEECYTLLVEIEAVLNSRPLTAVSTDPQDLSVLTPSHFLIGDYILQPTQRSYLDIPDTKLSRWQHIQKVRQDFWVRWQKEYLTELQRRQKWTTGDRTIQKGTLVLLKEDNLPPLQWALGKIQKLHPGPDGEVRVITVKTVKGLFKRSVRDACPIPMDYDIE